MGTLDLRAVGSWRVRRRFDADDGEPVGTRKCLPLEHTATLSMVGPDGRVVYGEELPIGVYASEVRDLPSTVTERLGIPRMHAWLFMAAASTDHDTVCFSALPYSQGRFFSAPLRPTKHRQADEINRALVAAIEATEPGDPEQRLQRALNELPFVPFLHRRRSSAAWMIHPSRHELLGTSRFNEKREYTVGVCRDWGLCVAQLHGDPLVTRLLDLTLTGDLFKELPNYEQRKRGPIARPVSDDAKASSELAMDLAIQLALAGVVDGQRLYGANGTNGARANGANVTGAAPRYVALQVEPIYRDIIYKWSRRTSPPAPPLSSGVIDIPTTARERIESMREVLKAQGETDVIQKLTEHANDWHPADETAVRLVLACPPDWRLSPELDRFLRLALRKLDPESLEYILVRERLRSRSRG